MIITSNLTTLNMDGDNSSVDINIDEVGLQPQSSEGKLNKEKEDDELEREKSDQKYLQQFRKKQQMVPAPASSSAAAMNFPDDREMQISENQVNDQIDIQDM